MSECMTFPDTVEEFMDSYKIVDTEQVYTNGMEMVPIYRMRQWFQHEPERKKGKWNTYYHGDIDFSYSCNQCGYSAPYQMIGGKVFQKKGNFCHNCGADMSGDDHDL